MIHAIAPVSQNNFPPGNLPSGSADFYNSAMFASNMSHLITSAIDEDQKAMKKANEELKEALSGDN